MYKPPHRDNLAGHQNPLIMLYCLPATILLWLQYMNPQGGYASTRTTARRARSPIMSIIISTICWFGIYKGFETGIIQEIYTALTTNQSCPQTAEDNTIIIIDFNAIAIGNITTQKLGADEDLIRHTILNTIRSYNVKYRKEYGQMYVACDGGSWRKDYFEFYKAKRKKNREESVTDWGAIFEIINKVRQEIDDNLQWKVVHQLGVEADDIIATLVDRTTDFGRFEPVMIISADHDFKQLHRYDHVKQFSPITKKLVTSPSPRKELLEKVLKGDAGDGVPNVLSPDDIFLKEGARQTPLTKKKIEHWIDNYDQLEAFMTPEEFRNYKRNDLMINLDRIPEDIKEKIINKIEEADSKKVMGPKLLNYLIKNRCKLLIECIEDFN